MGRQTDGLPVKLAVSFAAIPHFVHLLRMDAGMVIDKIAVGRGLIPLRFAGTLLADAILVNPFSVYFVILTFIRLRE